MENCYKTLQKKRENEKFPFSIVKVPKKTSFLAYAQSLFKTEQKYYFDDNSNKIKKTLIKDGTNSSYMDSYISFDKQIEYGYSHLELTKKHMYNTSAINNINNDVIRSSESPENSDEILSSKLNISLDETNESMLNINHISPHKCSRLGYEERKNFFVNLPNIAALEYFPNYIEIESRMETISTAITIPEETKYKNYPDKIPRKRKNPEQKSQDLFYESLAFIEKPTKKRQEFHLSKANKENNIFEKDQSIKSLSQNISCMNLQKSNFINLESGVNSPNPNISFESFSQVDNYLPSLKPPEISLIPNHIKEKQEEQKKRKRYSDNRNAFKNYLFQNLKSDKMFGFLYNNFKEQFSIFNFKKINKINDLRKQRINNITEFALPLQKCADKKNNGKKINNKPAKDYKEPLKLWSAENYDLNKFG